MITATQTTKDWISGAELDRRLSISWKIRARVVLVSGIRSINVPGAPIRYSREDVIRVAREAQSGQAVSA